MFSKVAYLEKESNRARNLTSRRESYKKKLGSTSKKGGTMVLEHKIEFFKNEEGHAVVVVDGLPPEMKTITEKRELLEKVRDLQITLADFTYWVAMELLPYNICANQTH